MKPEAGLDWGCDEYNWHLPAPQSQDSSGSRLTVGISLQHNQRNTNQPARPESLELTSSIQSYSHFQKLFIRVFCLPFIQKIIKVLRRTVSRQNRIFLARKRLIRGFINISCQAFSTLWEISSHHMTNWWREAKPNSKSHFTPSENSRFFPRTNTLNFIALR